MPSVFTKIINGELPSYKVAEDENNIAFLDINPLKKGHTLVVPRKEVDYLFDLPENDYLLLQNFARRVAWAIENTVTCKRIGVAVLGLEVPHAHIHLVPIDHEGDINFANPRVNMSESAFTELAGKINQQFNNA